MTGVAVGDRDKANAVSQRRVLCGDAAGTLVAIVRMGAERDDVELPVGWRLRLFGSNHTH